MQYNGKRKCMCTFCVDFFIDMLRIDYESKLKAMETENAKLKKQLEKSATAAAAPVVAAVPTTSTSPLPAPADS